MEKTLSATIFALLLLSASASAYSAPQSPQGLAMAAGGQTAKFIVLSEKTGEQKFKVNQTIKAEIKNLSFKTKPRAAVKYSPLAWYLPEAWVPIVASAIGAFLISLTHQFLSLGQNLVESLISDRKKQKTAIKHTAFRIVGIKVREVLSVTAAAFILGAAISWTYAGPTSDFIWLMGLNTFICLLAGISHEAVHRIVGRLLGITAEYTFWFTGSVLTIVTAILGNAFGLQGMLVEEVAPNTPKWKLGVMKLAAPLFSMSMMVLFAAINYLSPHVVFQMAYSISGMLAMAEILPFKPMDGYDIRKWNIFVWFFAFLTIAITFSLLSFIMAS